MHCCAARSHTGWARGPGWLWPCPRPCRAGWLGSGWWDCVSGVGPGLMAAKRVMSGPQGAGGVGQGRAHLSSGRGGGQPGSSAWCRPPPPPALWVSFLLGLARGRSPTPLLFWAPSLPRIPLLIPARPLPEVWGPLLPGASFLPSPGCPLGLRPPHPSLSLSLQSSLMDLLTSSRPRLLLLATDPWGPHVHGCCPPHGCPPCF